MRERLWQVAMLVGCVGIAGPATAQEIVHALSGTVTQVDAQAKTLRLKTNDGSEGLFNFAGQGSTAVNFDRDVKTQAVPVASFNKPNDEVVVFYYGNGDTRTAVAVKDLGPGPFTTVEGTVTKFNRHQRVLTLKDASGKEEEFHLDPKAAADTPDGAVPGDKFSPSSGDNVRVIATTTGGTNTALFVRD